MRHGIVAVGGLVIALSLTSWIVAAPTLDEADGAAGSRSPDSARPRGLDAGPVTAPILAPALPAHLVIEPVLRSLPEAISNPIAGPDRDGQRFLADLNELRVAHDVAPLVRRASLDAMAQSWAETMVASGLLQHSTLIYDMVDGSWTRAGENVGYGPSAASVFAGLEESPGHLANMIDPNYTSVGIGTVRIDDVLWTAHLFAG